MNEDSLILLGAGLVVGLWVWTSQARERVDALSRDVCQDMQLQRLDEAVALRRIRVLRTATGLAVERIFSFEFSSTGADRRRAEVCLWGLTPQWVRLDHPDGPIHIDLHASR